MQPTFNAITQVTLIFALVLALSFVIERILEFLKAAFDMFDSRFDFHEFWTRRTYRTKAYVERQLRIFEYVEPKAAAAFLRRFDQMLLGPGSQHSGTVPVLCGDLVRAAWIRAGLKAVGIGLGIILAFAFGLDLLAISRMQPPDPATGIARIPAAEPLGQLATGIITGLGSGVVHKIISALERRQRKATVEVSNA